MKSKEPRTNVRPVCEDHAPRPDPQFLTREPSTFVGHWVKIAFPARGHKEVQEHMWCEVVGVCHDGTLAGQLDNEPVYAVGYVCGSLLSIRLDQIEAELVDEEECDA